MSGNNDAAICGVNEDVAHVSSTSFSPTKSLEPHLHALFGLSFTGSTGRSFSSGRTISPHFLQYHTGIGTPKLLCLDMHQSHCRPLTQLSNLFFMKAGCQLSFSPALRNFSLGSRYLMNHCGVSSISMSVPHLSWVFTAWVIGVCESRSL